MVSGAVELCPLLTVAALLDSSLTQNSDVSIPPGLTRNRVFVCSLGQCEKSKQGPWCRQSPPPGVESFRALWLRMPYFLMVSSSASTNRGKPRPALSPKACILSGVSGLIDQSTEFREVTASRCFCNSPSCLRKTGHQAPRKNTRTTFFLPFSSDRR